VGQDGGDFEVGWRVSTAEAVAVWRRPAVLRVLVWAGHLVVPAVGAVWLVVRPEYDWFWQDNLAHLLIVGAGSGLALWLGIRMSGAADQHDDARLRLLSLALVATAGFQLLHALATPAVLVDARTSGFDAATPVGLLAAALFAAASAIDLSPTRQAWVSRNHRRLLVALLASMLAWFVVSIAGLPPLDQPMKLEDNRATLVVLAIACTLLYGGTAWSYFRVHRKRPAVMLLGVVTAMALLAETMIVLAMGRTWRVTWWEWHVLQAFAFGFLAYAARSQYRREGTATGLFTAIALDETIANVQRGHREALQHLVTILREQAVAPGERARMASNVATQFDLSEQQRAVLGESADLYVELDGLFRSYLSPDVAEQLVADPSRAELGGRIAEVTVLMADLQGFTAFSEQHDPADVVGLLNRFYGAIVPIIIDEGGTVVQFVGDAVMAVFNAPREHADHAIRAVRCGLRMQAAVGPIADATPGAPRFRVGINTGPALVGNIGADQMRNFTAIGDTTNTAARIEGLAQADTVLVSATTRAALPATAVTVEQPGVMVKNKAEPLVTHLVHAL